MSRIYALLVGINKYQSPTAQLKGCVSDANRIEKYLNKYQRDRHELNILKLTDDKATYQNIIDGFRNHLRLATEEDMVWFHFSGHGSEEKTAPEFIPLEPGGRDQTMLCYDSIQGGAYNIADKELAVLLNEVSTSFPDGRAKTSSPHILVSLDCCHSGSGTRDAGQSDDILTRHSPTSNVERPIDSYVGGYYAEDDNYNQIPSSPHVLLSACQSYQLAGDLSDGGAFTSGLLRALKSSNSEINYADLFIRTRASVKNIRQNQLPNFTSIQNFDPYTRFLGNDRVGHPEEFEVFFANGKWSIKCGAIHGLPSDGQQEIEVEIRSVPPDSKKKGVAKIVSVGAQQSELDMNTTFGIRSTLDSMMPGEDHYRGILKFFPAPAELVYIEGDEKKISELKNNWDSTKNIGFTENNRDEHYLKIEAGEKYTILDRRTNRSVFTSPADPTKSAQECVESLGRMVKWHRLKVLENKSKKSKLKDRFSFEVDVYDTAGNITRHKGRELKLYATTDNSNNGQFGFNPKVLITDTSQDLFFYLLYLRPNYAIECPDDEVPFYKADFLDKTELEMNLWKQIQGFGPAAEEDEVTCHFKLLATTEKLDYYQFLQSGLGNTRSQLTAWNPSRISNDWASADIKITIARQDNQVSPDRNLALAHGALEVMAHPTIGASISLATAERDSRSVDTEAQLLQLENDHFQLMNLSQDRSSSGSQIIELNSIRPEDIKSLKTAPLQLKMNTSLDEHEYVVPMVHDGHYFRIAGNSSVEDDKLNISINHLPTKIKSEDDEIGDRSILSSFKLAFFKVVLNRENTNELRSVSLDDLGEIKLSREGLAAKIMNAKSVLILVHGLMGDGMGMIKNMSGQQEDLLDLYDCVLTYDYECLHTALDKTAQLLKEDLEALNLHTNADINIDIVAHSCGGLVARWLIEQEGWASRVNHLVMLGTPNNGSLYGKIEEYRTFSVDSLELVINFLPNLIPGAGLILKTLRYIGNMTESLGQMSPDSKFLTKLNTSSDPNVAYSIVSGDARHTNTDQSQHLINQLYRRASKSTMGDLPHDLFATVSSVNLEEIFGNRAIKPGYKSGLERHHFNLIEAQKINELIPNE